MRKIVYVINVSLDGYIEDAQGSLDWSNPSEQLHRHFNDLEGEFDLHLYGRKLYEIMSAFWPTADQEPAAPDYIKEYALIWQAMPKVVFSRTLEQVGWNSRLVRTDLASELKRLKSEPGKAISVGGAELAGAVMRLGQVDALRLYVHPVVLGGGKPAFPILDAPLNLEFVKTQT